MWSGFASEQRKHGQNTGSSRGNYGYAHNVQLRLSVSVSYTLILSTSVGMICQHIVYVYKPLAYENCTHPTTSQRHFPLSIPYHHQNPPKKDTPNKQNVHIIPHLLPYP